ncbi:MAG: ABC transporter permease [Dehalococcoidia bacterium]
MQNTLFAAIPTGATAFHPRAQALRRDTGFSRWTVLASQGLARLALALVTTALLLAAGWLLFRVRLDADWPGMVGFVILGATTFMAMGLAVSGLAPTAESVPALVQVVSFPMMFLSGKALPIESFPGVLQPLIRALPLTHLADALRQTMVGGAALQPLWLDALALAAWGLVAWPCASSSGSSRAGRPQ